jgi:TfoX/Sxy family transcriptional regulator of competence genes
MAYDDVLAARVRDLVEERAGGPVTEQKMFGGLGFMVNTHMAIGLHNGGGLIMTVSGDAAEAALARGAEPMTMGGKVSTGWFIVPDEAIASEEALTWWVETGVGQALAKAPKPPKAPKAPRKK